MQSPNLIISGQPVCHSYPAPEIMKGRSFIVTGGSSGLGAATVELLLSKECNVAILDRNLETASELRTQLWMKYPAVKERDSLLLVEADVTSEGLR